MNSDMDGIQECPICFEEIKKYGFCVTNCSHVFCMNCMVESMKQKRSCPLCRKNMDPEVTAINDTADYRFGYQMGYEDGYEEGMEIGTENAQKNFDEQRTELIRRHLKLKEEYHKVKNELDLTLHQFNTSIIMKNAYKTNKQQLLIPRSKSLD